MKINKEYCLVYTHRHVTEYSDFLLDMMSQLIGLPIRRTRSLTLHQEQNKSLVLDSVIQ